jgi:lantibiotic modifying enzyme
MSHGSSGIVWALAQLGHTTGNRAYTQAAVEGLRFDRAQYSYTSGDWVHARVLTGELEGSMHAWCHGPSGIGLARTLMQPYLDDDVVSVDIDEAAAATIRHGFGQNDCLCHGDVGNAMILEDLGRALERPEWRAVARARMSGVRVRGMRDGWKCGLPGQAKGPTLMTGMSGIGLGLLRFAHPGRVPSVLSLEGPLGHVDVSD